MECREDPALPGFLINVHPGMGTEWTGRTTPYEVPMMTAACIMMRAEDYRLVGGLDEGYLVGDFEDSDLCIALRKQGKRLWLVPDVQLWHLERQSQKLGGLEGHRMLLTLYNAWRYKRRIEDGLIADPRKLASNAEATS